MSEYQILGIFFVFWLIVGCGFLFWLDWENKEYGRRNKEFLEYARKEYKKIEEIEN